MKRGRALLVLAACGAGCASPPAPEGVGAAGRRGLPAVLLRDAPEVKFPSHTDSNSPAHWDGDTLYLFNSAGKPRRSFGPDLFHLGGLADGTYDNKVNGGRWVECTWKADDGLLYGWYHFEPRGVCPGKKDLTAPRIGAVRSEDNGATWKDLGVVLESPPDALRCDTPNRYFAGGNGDFSVMLDPKQEHVYLFFGTYHAMAAEQGVAVARMRFADRDEPVGKVWKWHGGTWGEPGVGGRVTPIFPAARDWHVQDCDTFWGPSIHWNTHLQTHVVLLNRSINKDWRSEGFYVSFNRDVSDPKGWSKPEKILDGKALWPQGMRWYPQVIGLEKGGTDKRAGKTARFFVHGVSRWEAVFLKPGEKE